MPDDTTNAVENLKTDSILWYNVGIFGDMGYAVPNPSNDVGTLNPNLFDITNLIGRGVFLMMHHEDADMSVPPSINTLRRVHKLYVRVAQIVSNRAVPDGTQRMESDHVSPAGEIFRVWPHPYFKVRNAYMKRWCMWMDYLLADLFQHTENRLQVEISVRVAQTVQKYMHRVYSNMAVELFGKTREEVFAPAFLLTDEDLAAYNPAAFFTDQEMIDPVPALDNVLSEDRRAHLSEGIPLSELPELQPWPANLTATYERMRAAREELVNPDTGQRYEGLGRVTPAPVWPTTFV